MSEISQPKYLNKGLGLANLDVTASFTICPIIVNPGTQFFNVGGNKLYLPKHFEPDPQGAFQMSQNSENPADRI